MRGIGRVLAFYALLSATCFCGAASLRELANGWGLRIGSAVDPSLLEEPLYGETLAREFNQIEPESVMKFGLIHPHPDSYNFVPAEALVKFAREHGMVLRGHTLVWHSQLASWLTEGHYTPPQLAAILEKHIQTVVSHFAGQVYAWDVVNEAFNEDGTVRSTLWSDSPGIGLKGVAYVEQAFRWARAADPHALLFYNDYDGEGINLKADAIYAMAKDFRARGVPIDGIGLQMHLTSEPPPLAEMEANIQRIAALGLQVQITELDVRLPVDAEGNATPEALATQALIYHDITALCLKFSACTAIQTWGFTDRHSWIPGYFPGTGAALAFDTAYRAKPAYQSMEKALRNDPKNGN